MTLLCQFPAKELHGSYYVTIGKASEEPLGEQIQTTEPEITLILSYSAYHVQIRAVNNVSSSPALSHVIPWRQDKPSEFSLSTANTNHLKASVLLFTGYEIISYTFFFFSFQVWEPGSLMWQFKATHPSPSTGEMISSKTTSATLQSGWQQEIKQRTCHSLRTKTTTGAPLNWQVCKYLIDSSTFWGGKFW